MDYLNSFGLLDLMGVVTAGFAVLLALPMMLGRNRGQARLFLAVFILIQGGITVWGVLTWSPVVSIATHKLLAPFEHVPESILLGLQGPILLWYSYGISGNPVRPSWFDKTVIAVFLLLPVPLVLLLPTQFKWSYSVCVIPGYLISIAYGIGALRQVINHNRGLRQRFSNIEERQLLWLGYLAFGFIAVWGMRLIGNFVGILNEVAGMFHENLGGTIGVLSIYPFTILICWMAVLGMGQGVRAADRPRTETAHHAEEGATAHFNPEMIEKLDDLMSRVKLYQDPDLHLDGLADSMGISTRSLSALINGHHEQNFYDFVNDYRVRDAQRQLEDPSLKSKTIQRVFKDAGFNSKSTFNTFFKRVTGKTPSEYRNAALSEFDFHPGGSAH